MRSVPAQEDGDGEILQRGAYCANTLTPDSEWHDVVLEKALWQVYRPVCTCVASLLTVLYYANGNDYHV